MAVTGNRVISDSASNSEIDTRTSVIGMTTYVTLLKFTSKGPDSIIDFGEAWEQAANNIASLGIRIVGAYGLLGPYDMMVIYEAADQNSAAKLPLSLSSFQGNVKTETWTTIPLREFTELPRQLRT